MDSFLGTNIPAGGKICVFHGRPHPSEVSDDWVLKHYKIDVDNVFHKPKISVVKTSKNYELTIENKKFLVANHWFWDQFSDQWEPQTYDFFERNLVKGSGFLDIWWLDWATSLIATAIGAGKVKIIEPIREFFTFYLLSLIINFYLIGAWSTLASPIKVEQPKLAHWTASRRAPSATNIRNPEQQGAEILSKIEEILHKLKTFLSLK